jgi:hypothetical protein
MKRVLFLILMAFILACFMPAQETGGDEGGDGEPQEAFVLTAAMTGNGAEIRAVAPDSERSVVISERFDKKAVITEQSATTAERFVVISSNSNKFLRCGNLDGIIYIGDDKKTDLYKEALTLRGA